MLYKKATEIGSDLIIPRDKHAITRYKNTAVVVGGKIGYYPINEILLYNADDDEWRKVHNNQKPRYEHLAESVYTDTEEIFVIGGIDHLGNLVSSNFKIVIDRNSIEPITFTTAICKAHSHTIFNRYIVMSGGMLSDKKNTDLIILDTHTDNVARLPIGFSSVETVFEPINETMFNLHDIVKELTVKVDLTEYVEQFDVDRMNIALATLQLAIETLREFLNTYINERVLMYTLHIDTGNLEKLLTSIEGLGNDVNKHVVNMKDIINKSVEETGNAIVPEPPKPVVSVDSTEKLRDYYLSNGHVNYVGTTQISDWSNAFKDLTDFNSPIAHLDFSGAINIDSLLEGCDKFNQPLDGIDWSKVTSANRTFKDCTTFNQDVSVTGLSDLESVIDMFSGTSSFKQRIDFLTTTDNYNENMSGFVDNSPCFYVTTLDNEAKSVIRKVVFEDKTLVWVSGIETEVIDISNLTETLQLNGFSVSDASSINTTVLNKSLCSMTQDDVEPINITPVSIITTKNELLSYLEVNGGFSGIDTTSFTLWDRVFDGIDLRGIDLSPLDFSGLDDSGRDNVFYQTLLDYDTVNTLQILRDGDLPDKFKGMFFEVGGDIDVYRWSTAEDMTKQVSVVKIKDEFFVSYAHIDDVEWSFSAEWDTIVMDGLPGELTESINSKKIELGSIVIEPPSITEDGKVNLTTDVEVREFYEENGHLNGIETGSIRIWNRTFYGLDDFNPDVSDLDFDSAIELTHVFRGTNFNQDLSGKQFPNVIDASYMFKECPDYHQPHPNFPKLEVANSMYADTRTFNKIVDGSTMPNLSSVERMFEDANNFDIVNVKNFTVLDDIKSSVGDSFLLGAKNYDSISETDGDKVIATVVRVNGEKIVWLYTIYRYGTDNEGFRNSDPLTMSEFESAILISSSEPEGRSDHAVLADRVRNA